jgi:hypothetical protein
MRKSKDPPPTKMLTKPWTKLRTRVLPAGVKGTPSARRLWKILLMGRTRMNQRTMLWVKHQEEGPVRPGLVPLVEKRRHGRKKGREHVASQEHTVSRGMIVGFLNQKTSKVRVLFLMRMRMVRMTTIRSVIKSGHLREGRELQVQVDSNKQSALLQDQNGK